jgi:hypothetical protein
VPVAAGGLALALIAVRYRYLERAEHAGSLLQGGTPQSRTTPA